METMKYQKQKEIQSKKFWTGIDLFIGFWQVVFSVIVTKP